jgi:hypothetical protein
MPTNLLLPEVAAARLETRIAYVLVQDSGVQRYSSVFRLVPEANVRLLRCFMTASQLPGDAARIRAAGRPFTEAATRIQDLPQIRITCSAGRPDDTLWNGMMNMPLVVLMVGQALPDWAETLAAERPAVVLSQDEAVLAAADRLGLFPGLLQGKKDLREFYGALQKLCAAIGGAARWNVSIRDAIGPLGGSDLLAERSRLDFIPPMPLPPTDQGRSAAYLYNRLSNNEDEPSLAPTVPDGTEGFFRSGYRWMLWGCRALALAEAGMEPPAGLGVTSLELADAYGKLIGRSASLDKVRAQYSSKASESHCDSRSMQPGVCPWRRAQ